MTETRRVRLFTNGRNQAVRIPREFELPGDEAILRKEGDRLILEPAPRPSLLALLKTLPVLEEEFPEIEDSEPSTVTIHRIRLTRETLDRLSVHLRGLLFTVGQIHNELQTIQRILLLTVGPKNVHPWVESITGARATIILALLIGKIKEAQTAIEKRLLASSEGRSIVVRLDAEGKALLRTVKKQLGGALSKEVARIRNNHSFHFSHIEEIDAAYRKCNRPLEIFVGEPGCDGTFFDAAGTVFHMALFDPDDEGDLQNKVAQTIDLAVSCSRSVVKLAQHITLAILDEAGIVLDMDESISVAAALSSISKIPAVTAKG